MIIKISVTKLFKYVRRNLGVPFIVLFQINILVSAFILIYNNANHLIYLAEVIAIQAFYLLIIGVILQFFSFLKYPEDNNFNE